VNTYATHKWVFKDQLTGASLLVNNTTVFTAKQIKLVCSHFVPIATLYL